MPNNVFAATGGIIKTLLSIGTSALSKFKINARIPASEIAASLVPEKAVVPVPINAVS